MVVLKPGRRYHIGPKLSIFDFWVPKLVMGFNTGPNGF
jgi:hypothetical protein